MKFLCVFVLAAAVIQCLGSDCRTQTGIYEDLEKKFSDDVFVDDPIMKEYIFCTMKSIGFVDESGDFLFHNIRRKFREVFNDEAALERYIKKCTVKQETPQETAFKSMTWEMARIWVRIDPAAQHPEFLDQMDLEGNFRESLNICKGGANSDEWAGGRSRPK
ncbi:hypothetical protein GEV33_014341 [Tenebrio molitor]|uniref:Uncharacterized protein n=1 Tax=Tenebrio molitor TaxID=7067 RepID=A0A8J6L1V6_TENMO|nr:hypothetical protein GEV33_014341 [Tenebrio molitor]